MELLCLLNLLVHLVTTRFPRVKNAVENVLKFDIDVCVSNHVCGVQMKHGKLLLVCSQLCTDRTNCHCDVSSTYS